MSKIKQMKIECPFCHEEFYQERKTGIMTLTEGIKETLKNKPYVECPHCKMKIMQG